MDYIDILVKLRKIIRSINLENKRIEKQYGISIPQLLCLKFLSEQPGYRATASQLKDFIKLNASTISGILTRLEGKGLTARLTNQADKRVSDIILTAQGADILQHSPVTLQEKLSKHLSRLSDAQIEELNKNIDLLVQIMEAGDLEASPVITIQELGS
ncbi:MAG: MarR family transcriptional regulator [Saprospiraceae bacterium]|jgi:DNA-binding MarR family transcriptional regulator|nr:MarR family transcriptional regulator [Lewinellaceae bacterium]